MRHEFRIVFTLDSPDIVCVPPAALPGPTPPVFYPLDSKRNLEEGRVELRFWVNQDGSVEPRGLTITESSGFPGLDGAALQTMLTRRFAAGRCGDKPIGRWHGFRVVYKLDEPEGFE